MDGFSNDVEVLSEQRSVKASSFLITIGLWHVQELVLTQQKIDWLWSQVKRYPTLFSDLTKGKAHAFLDLLEVPYSYWLEILDTDDKTIGIVYVTDLGQQIDANFHLFFVDRDLSNKSELVKEILDHVFNKFPALHRLTATMPDIYFATKRLAIKSGFKLEGTIRESLLIGGKWRHEARYGILAKEVLNGND